MARLVDHNNLPCPKCMTLGFRVTVACGHCGFQVAAHPIDDASSPDRLVHDGLNKKAWEQNWVPRFEQIAEDRRNRKEFDRDWPVALDLIQRKAGDRAWKKAGLDRAKWEFKYEDMGMDQILARLANSKDQE